MRFHASWHAQRPLHCPRPAPVPAAGSAPTHEVLAPRSRLSRQMLHSAERGWATLRTAVAPPSPMTPPSVSALSICPRARRLGGAHTRGPEHLCGCRGAACNTAPAAAGAAASEPRPVSTFHPVCTGHDAPVSPRPVHHKQLLRECGREGRKGPGDAKYARKRAEKRAGGSAGRGTHWNLRKERFLGAFASAMVTIRHRAGAR